MFGRTTWVALAMLAGASGVARADDKDTSGALETWVVTKEGADVIGTESLRLVTKDDGQLYSSGEAKVTLGKKKVHLKSHLQRGPDGRLAKYQRVENGLKGAGIRVFEFDGQLRIAPVNGPGKPAPLGAIGTGRVLDADLWHLYATWGVPGACEGTKKLGYFDPEKKATAEATLTCQGEQKVYDAQKKPVTVGVWHVTGVPHEVDLWVDAQGKLAGVKGKDRWMLRSKWLWEPGEKVAPVDSKGDGDDEVDRGIGE